MIDLPPYPTEDDLPPLTVTENPVTIETGSDPTPAFFLTLAVIILSAVIALLGK